MVIRRLRRGVYFLVDIAGYVILYIPLLVLRGRNISAENANRILVIRIDRIGDVILSTPALKALRCSFPNAEINMFIAEYARDLVVNNPNIDRLLVEKDHIDNDYDLALVLHPGFYHNYLAVKSGAKLRVGYTGWGGGFFLTHRLKDDRETRVRHEVESALEAVKIIGGKTEDKKLEISTTIEGERFANEYLRDNNIASDDLIIIIHPGARQEYIRWRAEGFAEVAEKLIRERKAKVILIEGVNENELVEYVLSLMEEKPLVARDMSLTQLVSLIKRGKLFIGNSTGPMHIAAALEVPVVAIFGNIHPLDSYQEWGPWGEGHTIVTKDLDCVDCHPSDCKTFDCMEQITPEEVLKAVRKTIS